MVRPLFLLLSNVGWPFAVGFIGVGEVTRCMSEVTWIYHPDFPAENGSGFMINERLLLPMAPAVFRWPLNVDVDPSWHTEPQGHAIMERWLVGKRSTTENVITFEPPVLKICVQSPRTGLVCLHDSYEGKAG